MLQGLHPPFRNPALLPAAPLTVLLRGLVKEDTTAGGALMSVEETEIVATLPGSTLPGRLDTAASCTIRGRAAIGSGRPPRHVREAETVGREMIT